MNIAIGALRAGPVSKFFKLMAGITSAIITNKRGARYLQFPQVLGYLAKRVALHKWCRGVLKGRKSGQAAAVFQEIQRDVAVPIARKYTFAIILATLASVLPFPDLEIRSAVAILGCRIDMRLGCNERDPPEPLMLFERSSLVSLSRFKGNV